MRVLLLLVASTYAMTPYTDWDAAYDVLAADDLSGDTPALPTGAGAAHVIYDALMTAEFPKFAAGIMGGDFVAAKAAVTALVAGCKAWQTTATAWPTDLTQVQKDAMNEAGAAALAVSWNNYNGECKIDGTAEVFPAPESMWSVDCLAKAGTCTVVADTTTSTNTETECCGAAGADCLATNTWATQGAWVSATDNVALAATWWTAAGVDMGDDWTATDGCDKSYAMGGSQWAQPSTAPMVAAAAVTCGLWDSGCPDPVSSADPSDASPAAALAAGVAAIALLL